MVPTLTSVHCLLHALYPNRCVRFNHKQTHLLLLKIHLMEECCRCCGNFPCHTKSLWIKNTHMLLKYYAPIGYAKVYNNPCWPLVLITWPGLVHLNIQNTLVSTKNTVNWSPHLPLRVVQRLGENIMIIQGPLCFAFVDYCDRIPCKYPDHRICWMGSGHI